jgi:hypothetical protein
LKGKQLRSEVHIAVTIDRAVFLDVTLCLAEYTQNTRQHFPQDGGSPKLYKFLFFLLKSASTQKANALRGCKMVETGTVVQYETQLSCEGMSVVQGDTKSGNF